MSQRGGKDLNQCCGSRELWVSSYGRFLISQEPRALLGGPGNPRKQEMHGARPAWEYGSDGETPRDGSTSLMKPQPPPVAFLLRRLFLLLNRLQVLRLWVK